MNFQKKLSGHKTSLNFLFSTLFLYGVTLVTGFVTYRYISPDYLGIWATFSTYTIIATFLRLGIPNGMNRELPFYIGKGDNDKAYSYASVTLFYSILVTIIIVITFILFFVFFPFDKYLIYSNAYRTSAIVFFLTILLEPYTTYLQGTFRTSENFDRLSKIQNIIAILRLITIIIVIKFGFNGYLAREAIIVIMNVLLCHIYRPLPFIKPYFNKSIFLTLLSIGFRIFIISYCVSFIETIPRLFIINMGTPSQIGLFSPISVILGIVYVIPNTLASYLYPKLSMSLGRGDSKVLLWKKISPLFLYSLGIGAIASLLVFLLIDNVILLFPKYIESATYLKLSCVGIMFIGYRLGNIVCNVLKEWNIQYIMTAIFFLIQIISIFIMKSLSDNVITIAVCAMSFTYLVMYIISFIILYKVTHPDSSEQCNRGVRL